MPKNKVGTQFGVYLKPRGSLFHPFNLITVMKYFVLPCFAVALLSLNQINLFKYKETEKAREYLQGSSPKHFKKAFTITGSASAGTIGCNGGITTVTATATGGVGNITYNINGTPAAGGTFTVTSSPQPNGGTYNFTGVPAGTYNVTATDENAETASIGSFTVTQPTSSGTSNGAPDLLLTSLISPSGSFPSPGTSINITYTIYNKNNTSITAQNLVLRVSRPFSAFTVELNQAYTTTWQKITNSNGYVEFRLLPGNQISCSGSASIGVIITRNSFGSQSPGVPITGILYFSSGTQDLNDFDNARSSQVRVQ